MRLMESEFELFLQLSSNIFAMAFQVFSGVFASVLDPCFKCFICLQTHFANVSSGCFKSRSDVANAAKVLVAGGQRLAAKLRLLPRAFFVRRASPTPFSPPSFPFPPSRRGSSSLVGNGGAHAGGRW
jgi:hypothetical protein